MYSMDAVLAILTPEVLTLLAYAAGAFVIGTSIIVGVLYLCNLFGWLP
jgi:hypothetical protein